MRVVVAINSFEQLYQQSYAGAIKVLDEIKKANKEELLMLYLDYTFEEPMDEIMLNDYIWFECDEIYEALGMKEVEEEW
jgi:hypothetical protein